MIFEHGQRVVVLDYLGNEIGTGRVFAPSGDPLHVANEHWTSVKVTWHGETRTDAWPTERVRRIR